MTNILAFDYTLNGVNHRDALLLTDDEFMNRINEFVAAEAQGATFVLLGGEPDSNRCKTAFVALAQRLGVPPSRPVIKISRMDMILYGLSSFIVGFITGIIWWGPDHAMRKLDQMNKK
jgi:hypothetical protein